MALLCPLLLGCATAEEIVLDRIHSAVGAGWVDYRVERAEIEKVPSWEPKTGRKAPLGRDRAVEIAKQAAAASGLGEKVEMIVTLETVNRYEKDILRRLPTDGCRWFYVVEFREEKKKPVFCVITMSGVVARPEPGGR